jgi:hypothetical protein
MSRALYSKCEDKIRETYRECLSDVISEAGKAEYELAKSMNWNCCCRVALLVKERVNCCI